MPWSGSKTKSITTECYNIYWSIQKRVPSSRQPDGFYTRTESFGTRYFKEEQVMAKAQELLQRPEVCEVYIVHHDPIVRWKRDDEDMQRLPARLAVQRPEP